VVAVGAGVPVVAVAAGVEDSTVAALFVELADDEDALLAGVLAVMTAVAKVARTSTTLIAITARSPLSPPGKSGRRIPIAMETTSAQTTSAPPAM